MKAKPAFTLTELLFVLGILFLLGVLTASVMARARIKSNESVCISNLHQIGLGLRMYMDDYDAQQPVQGVLMSPYQLGFPPLDSFLVFRDKYVGSRQVFYCPAYHGKKPIKELGTTYENHLGVFHLSW
jgi:type II secretory pathway pseudopilin PulG